MCELVNFNLGICESHIENTLAVSQLIQYHRNKGAALESVSQNYNLKKKNEGYHHRSKVYRCFLHSKKPMPNRRNKIFVENLLIFTIALLEIWREAYQSLLENDLAEMASMAEIEEKIFLLNLQVQYLILFLSERAK